MAGPRLFLQGICLVLTALAWIACFQRFCRQSRGFFKAYTPNSYGIFLFHEVPVIWMQYFLISSDLPALLKILAVLIIGLGSSWLLTALLRKSKFIQKIL
jgi:surface polysaccharide O-acyltransferase-like enzyme